MLLARIDHIHDVFKHRFNDFDHETCLAITESGMFLKPFDSKEEEQEFIDQIFQLYVDAYFIRAACEIKYGNFLKIQNYEKVEEIKLSEDIIENIKRSDTLLDLAFAKRFLNYGDWAGDGKVESIQARMDRLS